jgi:SNF2 family DNA or RNA helicase
MLNRRSAALFADPGLGKTVMTLLTLRALRYALGSVRVLISAPIRVIYDVWPEEIERWDSFDFTYTILHGKDKEKNLHKDVEIFLINPEGLKWLLNRNEFPDWNILVVDESSQYKNPSSVRFRLLKHLLPMFQYRYLLTGTPSPRSLLDLWSQVYILDNGAALGQKITHYRKDYFNAINRGNYFDYEIKPGMDEIIEGNTAPLALRMSADKYLDLPGIVYNDTKTSLPDKARKQYQQLSKNFLVSLESGKLHIESTAQQYATCRDFAGGAIYTKHPKYEVVHTAKIDAVKELVGELQGKPVMIVYHRVHEFERLRAAFPGAPAVNGQTKQAECSATLKRWNDGKLPILLVQCQSVTHGLNLQRGGNDLVWFSIPDDYEVYEQLNRRIYRRGTTDTVRIHHIVAKGTIDTMLLARLRDKKARQQKLFDAVLAYYQTGKIGGEGG